MDAVSPIFQVQNNWVRKVDSVVDKRVQKSAVLSLIFGFYSFPLPLGIRSTLGVTFWNWDFDSWLLVVEFWHLRVKFRSGSFLDPHESLFHRWKSYLGFLGVDIGLLESLLGLWESIVSMLKVDFCTYGYFSLLRVNFRPLTVDLWWKLYFSSFPHYNANFSTLWSI